MTGKEREKVLSVTIHDCEVQTFSAGGPGGQNQNRRSTGVRVVHRPSGARGESRVHRSQLQNKQAAFVRMAESDAFKAWVRVQTGHALVTEAEVQRKVAADMAPAKIRVETRADDGRWTETPEL